MPFAPASYKKTLMEPREGSHRFKRTSRGDKVVGRNLRGTLPNPPATLAQSDQTRRARNLLVPAPLNRGRDVTLTSAANRRLDRHD